jgi:hypothetical protein
MRFEDERYVRVYTRDTTTWKLLPWQSRALLPLIMRKLDRAGIMELVADESAYEVIAAHVDVPMDVVVPGLDALVKRQVVVVHNGVLFMPNFLHAQTVAQSDKSRAAKSRETTVAVMLAKTKGVPIEAPEEPNGSVTKRDSSSRNVTVRHETNGFVTTGHAPSHGVTPCHSVLCCAVPSYASTQDRAGAREGTHAETGDTAEVEPANPSPCHEAHPRTGDRQPVATHAASDTAEARKTHPGAIPDPSSESHNVAHREPGVYVVGEDTLPETKVRRGVSSSDWAAFGPDWEEVYAETVRSVTGGTWQYPTAQRRDMKSALEGHCVGPDANPAKVPAWVRKHVTAFVTHASREEPKFWSQFGPRGFLRWLNEMHHLPKAEPKPTTKREPVDHGPVHVPSAEEVSSLLRDLGAHAIQHEPTPAADVKANLSGRKEQDPEEHKARCVANFRGQFRKFGDKPEHAETFAALARSVAKVFETYGCAGELPEDVARFARESA